VWFTNDPEIDAANGDFIPAAAQQEAGRETRGGSEEG
jgi:hypothetical protein